MLKVDLIPRLRGRGAKNYDMAAEDRGAVNMVEEGVVSRLTGCLVMSLYIPQQVIWVVDNNGRGIYYSSNIAETSLILWLNHVWSHSHSLHCVCIVPRVWE